MVTGGGSSRMNWKPRDWLAALGLFAATAAVIVWQNAHVAVLWDLAYVLDTATRIALGQIPYRDFPLSHAPLTFLVQAAIIRLTGRVYWHHIVYMAAMGGAGTVLTWRIALRLLGGVRGAWWMALLIAAPLTVLGIYCVFPFPSYDCDCCFWILVAVWALVGVDGEPHPSDKNKDVARLHPTDEDLSAGAPRMGHPSLGWGGQLSGFAAGVLACVPLFFKQNMGLPFLAAVVGAAVLLVVVRRDRLPVYILLGAGAGMSAALVALHFTVGLGNYLHWTIQFASQRRLPGLQLMAGVYSDSNLLWMLGCVAAGALLVGWEAVVSHPSRKSAARMGHPGSSLGRRVGQPWVAKGAGFLLLAAPFLWALASLFIYDDADERGDALLALWPLLLAVAAVAAVAVLLRERRLTLRLLVPFILLAAVHGTLMSQQLWGSTYGIWPLLVLLVAGILAALGGGEARSYPVSAIHPSDKRPSLGAPAMAAVFSVTLVVCGAFYTASEERLSYVHIPAGPAMRSDFPELAGMAAPGPWLPQFDELLRYAEAKIPPRDGIVLIPGEDPFYFATGRVPEFPVLLFDPATNPYSPEQVARLAVDHDIHWLIIKRDLQLTADPSPDTAALRRVEAAEFKMVDRLRGYDIYWR
jgi:hypothetical protein